jgi:hypothetical protein
VNKRRQKGHFLRFGISHPLDQLRLQPTIVEAPNHTQPEQGKTGEEKGKSSILLFRIEERNQREDKKNLRT